MEFEWVKNGDYWRASFTAMASPCEILVDCRDGRLAQLLCGIAKAETLRIERKYSRYRDDSELSRINRSHGLPVTVDVETAQLLDYADLCYRLSHGKFDISSGVLRRLWRFDGSDKVPDADAVAAMLPNVGWDKVQWHNPLVTLPPDMELDFGGIGKEYAVDRCAQLCRWESDANFLINFGGDIYVSGPLHGNQPWIVAIDDPRKGGYAGNLQLRKGAIATSGDAQRFLLKDGIRYGHILDPLTGWPVKGVPRSVTVMAQTCVEAGMLATLAMLQGEQAEQFLQTQRVAHRCLW